MEIFSYIMLIIVGIGILNLLLMAVFERTREIGVLGAIGLRPGQISLLFLLEGAMMGLVGAAFGVALGLLFNVLLGRGRHRLYRFQFDNHLYCPDQRPDLFHAGDRKTGGACVGRVDYLRPGVFLSGA